ncbi:hypothetical protein DACRYDRAFT_22367 [Dacryopinax primogenitus]|uniref:Uncharacterized protein n=1 Tax=Dacryopinax primogenitus (strain DJM 731) TaxID=1858805 RepID=M5GCR7_DACPD|nr:uncharacterized protein DACRYDRAFT_22367 [Dacryopinax primogenitus]EJU01933.1 hypothetical protein DACRYDRAFT_22367 [Dacryopinax primogenitus]
MPEEFVSLLTPDTAHTLGDYLQSVVLPEEELEIGKVKVKGMEEARAQDKEKIRLMEEAHAQEKEKMKENTLALVKHAQKLADELSAAKTELEQTKTELEETKAELADVLSVVKTGLAPGPP